MLEKKMQAMPPPEANTLAPVQPVNSSPLHQIAKTYHELTTVFEQFMGMSRARWAALRLLNEQSPLTQADLTRQLRVDAAAVTRQVKQLEREGLVARWAAPEDNRFTVVALTDAGRRYVEAKRPRRSQFDAIVLEGLPPAEIEAMLRGLAHIRRNLEKLPLDPDPQP